MNTRYLFLPAAIVTFALIWHGVLPHVAQPVRQMSGGPESREREERTGTGSMQSLELWSASRAYPDADIPSGAYMKSALAAKARLREVQSANATSWRFMGPTNFTGRMLSVAINPLDTNTVYAGSASGGLWRSRTGGLTKDWMRLPLGYPILGVAAIVIDPVDTATMYIGTGEVYRYHGAHNGTMIRTTRGSYGMGILKSTDGGSSWFPSLDWSYNQERGVQAIKLNPLNHNTVFAATTEGVYRSRDRGLNWTKTLDVIMAEDIVIHASDTNRVMASCGNFISTGVGIYNSTNAGTTWTLKGAGLPPFSGKTLLEPYAGNPDMVYASVADSFSAAGAIYRTSNFGSSWAALPGTRAISMSSQGWYSHFIAVHPLNNSVIVEGGVNITRSINGGVSSTSTSMPVSDNHNYAHNPLNPDVLYVVNDGGVWKTNDFGGSYINVGRGIQTSQFYNLASSASDSNLAMGEVQDHFGYKYTGTLSWADGAVDEVGWAAISQRDDNLQFCTDRNGDVYRSLDRGTSYVLTTNGVTGKNSWCTPFLLAPSDDHVLYLGRDFIYKSPDYGESWYAMSDLLDSNPTLSMAMSSTSADTVYVGRAPLRSRVHWYRTTNGGFDWQDITGTLPDRYPTDLAVDPRDSRTVFAAVGGFGAGHFFRSTDAGISWTNISGALADVPGMSVLVDPNNSNVVYAGNDIGVFVSTDKGNTWQSYSEGLPEAVIAMDLNVSKSNQMLRMATHGSGIYERPLLTSPVAGVRDELKVPQSFALHANYPNPFNPSTTISWSMQEPGRVTLRIYDGTGRVIATLLADQSLSSGEHAVIWDASGVASGVYFSNIRVGKSEQTGKMILTR